MPPTLGIALCQIGEPGHGGGGVGQFNLVRGVIIGKGGNGLGNVIVIAEDKKLGRPGIAKGSDHRRDARGLDLIIVGFKFSPGLGNAQPEFFEDLFIV